MNNREHITEVIENISDRHIAEAADTELIAREARQSRKSFMMGIATVAACFCAAVGAVFAVNALSVGRGVVYSNNSSYSVPKLEIPDLSSLYVLDSSYAFYEENGGIVFVGEPILKYGMIGGTPDLAYSSKLFNAFLTSASNFGYTVYLGAAMGNFDEEYYSIAASYVYVYKDGDLITEPFNVGFTVWDRYGVPYPKNADFEPLRVYVAVYDGKVCPVIAYTQLDPKYDGVDYTFFYIIIDGTPYLLEDVSPVINSTEPDIFGDLSYGELAEDKVVVFYNDIGTLSNVE